MTSLTIPAPASKSMTQRALVIAALSPGTTRVDGPLVCDDSRHLSTLLRALGCTVVWHDDSVMVTSRPLLSPDQPVFCGNAGTAVRFGSCLSLLCKGPLTIDGDAHMRTRPIDPLAKALRQLGATVSYLEQPGCPPLRLTPPEANAPCTAAIDTTISSQYLSGLLMVGPCLARGLELELTGAGVSQPYVDMTIEMMRQAGVTVVRTKRQHLLVAPGGYAQTEALAVEADWSGAAFLLAAAEVSGVESVVPHILSAADSLQGDAVFCEMLAQITAAGREPVDLDLTHVPDLIAPLAAAALFASRPTRMRGAAHTRLKECDRVAVLAREFSKVGANMTEYEDGLDIEPLIDARPGPHQLNPEDDHRMAMAFGLLSLRIPGITVSSPECVSKSFPDFWDKLQTIRAHRAQLGDDRAT